MTAMKGGLKTSRFLFSLEKRFPADYAEMLARAEKYANAEEAIAARKETSSSRPEKREKRKREEPVEEVRAPRPRSLLPPRKYQEYTALNQPQSQILMEIHDQEEYEPPRKMLAPPEKRNRRKYCRFHKDHGHDTDECIQLKDEIEALIRRGRLARFVANKPNPMKPAEDKNAAGPSDNRPTAGVINTIVGGASASGGHT